MAVTPDHPGMTLPRAELGVLPTPLHAAPQLAEALGVRGRLLLKRDDLSGFAVAGNKTRPLEMLIAGAWASGARVLVTGGTPGSNFCQAAAAAAAWAGLRCVLVYAGSPSPVRHPNEAAAIHWGARIRWTHDPDRASVDAAIEKTAAELTEEGQTAFPVPRGGATPLGATGFHLAALELDAQLDGPATVVVGTGSGGTLAGLVSGAVALGRRLRMRGASVSRPPEETARRVLELSRGCARLMGTEPPREADVVLDDARGPGHGRPSEEGERAARLALRASGVVLDPVYSAKALGALARILGDRRADPDLTTVFWHTGGLLDAVAGWESR
ncbi:pyridoxal-phosphate dependent enzyme [Streptosporangium sp. NBC_01810]|uniref:1-aminocyclopropane-1-carboxylate deaminase/D-cysteine desulfhydrase n=1 Tax=Streptosporangium sp. NBC_01810 TaxID=2975951 RepID=UPI002DDA5F85|nr:pyridoxal-phosphate dependent enzyme [Streptosporangium sp. NBC_01810]WSA26450.1 pyridoxal-phosphate dependent enzyme [Streptosporangium sp. NBC_01810]